MGHQVGNEKSAIAFAQRYSALMLRKDLSGMVRDMYPPLREFLGGAGPAENALKGYADTSVWPVNEVLRASQLCKTDAVKVALVQTERTLRRFQGPLIVKHMYILVWSSKDDSWSVVDQSCNDEATIKRIAPSWKAESCGDAS